MTEFANEWGANAARRRVARHGDRQYTNQLSALQAPLRRLPERVDGAMIGGSARGTGPNDRTALVRHDGASHAFAPAV